MKTEVKNFVGIFILFLFYIFFASCNGNMEDKLEEIQKKLDTIEKEFKIERSTYNAMASSSFKDFVKLSYMHGVFNDPTYFDEEDFEDPVEDLVADFIDEIIDENLKFKDTIMTTDYEISFYNETSSTIILKAEGPERFNTYLWKFLLSKEDGSLELGFWDENDCAVDVSPSVKEKGDTLIITTEKLIIGIPRFQKLKHYYREATAAGYDCSKCDRWLLLSFPNVTVRNK